MPLTYLQVQQVLQQAGLELACFSDVLHGPRAEAGLPDTVAYPLLWIEDEMSINVVESEVRYSLAYLVLDRNDSELPAEPSRLDGEAATLSACHQRGEAVIGWISANRPDLLPGSGQSHSAISIHRDYADRVLGWRFEIVLVSEYVYTCDLPLRSLPPIPQPIIN